MNYNRTNNVTALTKRVAKFLLSVCVLSLALFIVTYSQPTSSSALPDCTTLTTNIKPGNNCLFNSQKLCSAIPSTSYTISSSNIASNPINRYNCYDLIDLPLCSQMPVGDDIPDEFKALPGQNCVQNCNDASFSGQPGEVRGTDFAVHKRDCIRFCDEVSAENTAFGSDITQSASTCTSRKCNQMPSGTSPSPGSNCDNLSCNLLSNYELIDVSNKINAIAEDTSDSSNNFCNGETDLNGDILKCYKFSSEQLPYVIRDRMCKIHNCTPTCSEYESTTDENGDGVIDEKDSNDVVNITNQGTSYTEAYETYINNGSYITDTSYCNPIICKPIIHRVYRCTTNGSTITGESSRDIVRNNNCDSTGDGSVCSNNYCYKEVDCNKSANASEPECANSGGDDDSIGSTEDTMDSWFYRPRPMDIATNGDGTIKSPMGSGSEELCYTGSQLESHSDRSSNKHCDVDGGRWGEDLSFRIPLPWGGHITIPLGYFHSSLCPDQTRSPGLCGDRNFGFRGNGYIYLCYGDNNPNSGNMYSKVSDETAYYKGYVKSTYTDEDGVHKVVMCLRFRNGLRPDDGSSETCGKRQCAISCMGFAGGCSSENCGYDVCKELTIKDSKPDECKMDDEIFNNDRDRDCMATIDPASTVPLRLRIQKYGDKICGFLDVKGHLAYETDFFVRGSEKTANGYCLDGSLDEKCSSKDTTTIPGEATKWRTMKFDPHIPYIKNNQPSGSKFRGYIDKFGQIYEEQDCIRVPLRSGVSDVPNLANSANMPKLSIPPIYITNSMVKKGGSISPSSNGEYGVTDFHEPELEVRFGNTTQKLSLSTSKTGYEETDKDPNASATITTTVNSIEYSESVFVRKEYDVDSKKPTFCLLQEIDSPDGSYIEPRRIGCVKRGIPPISSATQKLLILGDSDNTFESAAIILRYVSSFGANNTDNGCSNDDTCTPEVSIVNANPSLPTCDDSVEKYQVCAQREECSKLNSECMSNEIAIQNAKLNGEPYNSLLLIRNNCNDYLLPYCNSKKGLSTSNSTSMMTDTNLPAINNRYGWFNEICFVGSGKTESFDANRKKVFAYKQSNEGIDGKCIVSPLSPYLTDTDPSTNCDAGGKAPNCLCVEYIEGMAIEDYETVRLQTRREAGLCVDFPIPETCPAVIYNAIPNSNIADPDYISFSLDNMTYGSVNSVEEDNVVHISHKYRSEGVGHAEFPISVMGMNSVEGTCSGFWKNNTSAYGISQSPVRNCKNVNGNAEWDNVVTNECVRYKCPQISTSNPNSSGDYPGEYGASETAANKGLSNGYATWNSYTKTNDFLETVTAVSCINGFKRVGATAIKNGSVITSYNGGTLPQRSCNQIGQWGGVITNACQRIICSAVNPPINPVSNADWEEWNISGGATFPQINASRSSVEVLSESIQSGTCNTNLGFYQLGSEPPKRKCDYLGNWLTVENPCTTRCQAVTLESDAKSINHGYGYWNEANPPVGTSYLATSTGCVSGYVPYPYPPIKNSDGIKHTIEGTSYRGKTYKLSDTGFNGDDIIPLTVSLDSRTVSPLPQRWCKLVVADGVSSNYWYSASSQCINKCPGYEDDNRIGVGVTKHNTRNGQISINWTSTPLNTWVFINNNSVQTETTPDLTGHDASLYSTQNRTNGRFVLARKCGANGKWEDPIPQCVTNGGVISGSNAIYNTSNSGRADSKAIDVGDPSLGRTAGIATATSCITGGSYYQTGKDSGTLEPISDYTCEYSDSVQKNIDQTYFAYKSGSQCQVYCSATSDTNFGSPDSNNVYKSKYNGDETVYTKNGNYLTLKCNENQGYGRAILGSTGDTDVTSCDRTSKERSSTPPKALCNTDGSWGSITNQCEACRSCTKSSDVVSISSEKSSNNTKVEANSTDYTAYSSGEQNCGDKTISGSISGLIDGCGTNPDFSLSSGSCVRIEITNDWDCKKSCNGGVGECTRHTDLNATLPLKCADGKWVASTCSTTNSANCY